MAVELREHPRFSTYVNARLLLTDGTALDCQVLDYSQSGMHLLWPHGKPENSAGILTLELALDTQKIDVKVEWVFCNE